MDCLGGVAFKQNRIYNNTLSLKSQEMGCGVSSESANNVSLPQPASSSDLPARDLYDRKELMGVGNHGRVYRALHQLSGKEYAVKVIDRLAELNSQLGARERKGLVERLKKLKSPLITQYLEVEAREGEVAVVMELTQQGTLKKYIQKNGKLAEDSVSKITAQILQGLAYLHCNGLMHKDLKPSNVLMVDRGVQLSDYALAEIYDQRLTSSGERKGTDFSRGESLPYMAPEVIQNEGISEKADVWSVGCTVIEMLTGRVPWSDINPKFEKAFKEVTARAVPPLPKDISADCRAFLERCLMISPSKRSSVGELLKHPFVERTSGEQVDVVKASLQRTDTVNRISSRNSNKKQQQQITQNPKTPPSIQKSLKTQDPDKLKVRHEPSIQRQSSEPNGNSEKLKKLKDAVGNFGKIKKSRDGRSIYNDDILPEILEEEEGVMLNNRRVKLKPPEKFKTEQTDSSEKREYRNSIQLEENPSLVSLNGRYRIPSKPNSYLNESDPDSRVKLETEPVLMSSEMERDVEYFKKPLKLLKRKLKQRQKNSHAKYIDYSEHLLTEPPTAGDGEGEREGEGEESELPQQSKIRTLSQQREELAINTQLAKAERDRYINEQLAMRRQKEREKAKWEEELKVESEVIKKEFSHRYAYQLYHPVLNMI